MSTPKQPSPEENGGVFTSSVDSPLFVFDGPGDNTRRPARPNLPPPHWPLPEPPHDQSTKKGKERKTSARHPTPIPFCLTAEQFAVRFRDLLEMHSPALIRELREVLAKPIGEGVTGAYIEIFLDVDGEFGPGFGMYFDGVNKKVDHADQSIFPGRSLIIGEYVGRLPAFDRQYYSKKDFGALNIQGDVCKAWFAEWWWKAGGWSYPLKVEIDVHDGYGDGNGILLAPGS